MKKTLLFVASALMSLASFAQSFTAEWPKPNAPEFRDFAVEDSIYLWNVGAGGFYTNYRGDAPSYPAPYYGTRASVCDTVGAKVIFTQTNPAGTDETGNFADAPNAYLLVSYVSKFSAFYCTFADAWNGIWTDNNGNAARYFDVVESGNYIKIKPNLELSSYAGGTEDWFGIRASDADKIVYAKDPDNITADETFYDEWAAVSFEAYQTYYDFINSEEGKDMVARYTAAQTLKAQILGAQEKGISASTLADEYAVYNNLESTVEELNAAAASAYDKGRWVEIAPYFENVVQGEKNDVSGVFVNNDFSAGNANGWDITYTRGSTEATNIGYQGATYTNGEVTINGFIEAWKENTAPAYLGDGSITQTIPGLPAGMYMLAVDVIANNQGRISDADNPNGYPDDVELFATASLDGKTYKTDLYTKNGVPEHFEFTFVHTGGSMTLGLRVVNSAEAKMPANWIAMDNLKLFYYGELTVDPEKALLDAAIAKAEETYPADGLDEIVAYVGDKEAYATVIAEAKAATADYEEYQTKIAEAVSTLDASVAAYAKLAALVAKDGEWTKNNLTMGQLGMSSDLVGEYSDFVQSDGTSDGYPELTPAEVLEEMSLSAEEIYAYIELVDSKFPEAFASGMEPGMDVTVLLKNASFADGFTGWVTNHQNVYTSNDGAVNNVEVFQQAVDIYQIVEGVPDGVYSLTCQAFERPAGNGSYDGTEASKVFLFMNDYQTRVMNIVAGALPASSDAVSGENCYLSDPDGISTTGAWPYDYEVAGAGFVPNSMQGASYAFKGGRYVQEAKGLIEGGTMKIGLTSNGQVPEWVLWANFKLTYIGEDPTAFQEMLAEQIEALTQYMEENELSGLASDEIGEILDEASVVVEDTDIDELKVWLEKVKTAFADAQANVAAYAAFNEAVNALDEAYNEYGEEASESAIAEYEAAMEKAGDVESLPTEEIIALTEEITGAAAALKVPAYADATSENPVDFTRVIINNGFEEGNLNGWTDSGTINAQAQGNDSFDNKQGSYYCEKWHVNGTVDINQTVAKLPAGTYELSAYVYSSAADCYLYVNDEEVNVTTSQLYTITFYLAEETNEAKFGVKWSDAGSQWTCLDEFTLTYFGSDNVTAIENIASPAAAAPSAIYSISGARLNGLQKGLNIVKFSNGTVKKVFVK